MSLSMQEANVMYNSFPEGQTMSRQEFVKEVQQLTDSRRAHQDLQKIMVMKQTRAITEARNRQRIDGAMKDGR